jgi:hypothetical protein
MAEKKPPPALPPRHGVTVAHRRGQHPPAVQRPVRRPHAVVRGGQLQLPPPQAVRRGPPSPAAQRPAQLLLHPEAQE